MEPRFFSIKKHPPYKGENLWMERKLGSYPESSSTSLGHIPRPRGPSRTRSSSQEATQIAGWEDVLWLQAMQEKKSLHIARTGASQGFPRAAAPVGVFSRQTEEEAGLP